MVFICVELTIENIVKQADQQTRLKLPCTSGVVGRRGVLKGVEKGEPDRHRNSKKQNVGEESLETFYSLPAFD